MNTRKSVFSGLFWKFSERMGAQVVSFVVSIILARLLAPSDYGVVSMVNVFIAFADIIVLSGFGTALVQKKNADNIDFSTVFYFQLFISLVVYTVLFFSAPLISKFYGKDYALLTPVLRVLGLRLFLTGINSVQHAYVSKNMMFRKFFFSTLGGTIFSAVISIYLAYKGFGSWALVVQYLSNTVIDTIILFITVKWRPELKFSFKRLKGLYSFGSKMLVTSLITTFHDQLRKLLIGKYYSSADLAYYSRGDSYPGLIVNNINTSIDGVLFPAISSIQDNVESVKAVVRRGIKTSCYIMFPCMMGLAVVAEPLVRFMLTEKWMPCVPYIRIACCYMAIMPFQTANINAIKAMGRSDILLKLEIIKKTVSILAIVISVRYGVFWIAFVNIFTSVFASIVNSYPNKKLLNYGYFQQIKDVAPAFLLSFAMGFGVYMINYINGLSDLAKMLIQVPLGGIIYFGLSFIFKDESFHYLLNLLKGFLKKKKS